MESTIIAVEACLTRYEGAGDGEAEEWAVTGF